MTDWQPLVVVRYEDEVFHRLEMKRIEGMSGGANVIHGTKDHLLTLWRR
jgi:hypothetical protein